MLIDNKVEESETTKRVKSLQIEGEAEISYTKRDTLMHFNTKSYWHCFYDRETKILYNEYCQKILDNGYDYLVRIGMMDTNGNIIKYFQE